MRKSQAPKTRSARACFASGVHLARTEEGATQSVDAHARGCRQPLAMSNDILFLGACGASPD